MNITLDQFPFNVLDYRVPFELINPSMCQARKEGDLDARFAPCLRYEKQCSSKPAKGYNLCLGCLKKQEKMSRSQGRPVWFGLITDSTVWDNAHIPGSSWFYNLLAEGKFKYYPDGNGRFGYGKGRVGDSYTVSSGSSVEMSIKKPSNTLITLHGEIYALRKGNVYAYDEELKQKQWFIGRLTITGDIDVYADEI